MKRKNQRMYRCPECEKVQPKANFSKDGKFCNDCLDHLLEQSKENAASAAV